MIYKSKKRNKNIFKLLSRIQCKIRKRITLQIIAHFEPNLDIAMHLLAPLPLVK